MRDACQLVHVAHTCGYRLSGLEVSGRSVGPDSDCKRTLQQTRGTIGVCVVGRPSTPRSRALATLAVRFAPVEPFTPLPLERVREPFDDPRYVYELKYDGFRALAFVRPKAVTLVSRTGRHFGRRFVELETSLCAALRVRDAVLDGELACLDDAGRPQFRDLMFGRGTPTFVAFDLLAVNGRDVRGQVLLQRKRLLRRLVPKQSDCLLYADYVVGLGRDLFALVCAQDLEGIVAKRATAPYALVDGRSPFIKIKYTAYSQARDRHELFDR